jgi:hypothetical protein
MSNIIEIKNVTYNYTEDEIEYTAVDNVSLDIEKGSFTIHGKKVEFDERLSLATDSPDCTWIETKTIPESWNCEKIYRIRLTAPLSAGVESTFALHISN